MNKHLWIIAALLFPLIAHAQDVPGAATVNVGKPKVTTTDEGKTTVQDVTLSSAVASYTLTSDITELADQPGRATSHWWAYEIGYIPIGMTGPAQTGWYWQGFIRWTFDDTDLKDYPAKLRVIREYGHDAMVEYAWDTPKVNASLRFAMTSDSDKLLCFGKYEPKEEIESAKLRLMAYPATFSKPWHRSATTATRTLTEGGGVELDLATERWVLLEDTLEGRAGSGSSGLLLGDPTSYSKVTLDDIGGYGEYVNLALKPEGGQFALGFYQLPSIPDYEETRAYFRRIADAESDALAKLLAGDLDQPLTAMPVDADRAAQIARRDEQRMQRPAEIWRADPEPLEFPWASRLPGPPIKVALLCPRWSAYDTTELARRLEMDVQHQYFDSSVMIAQPNMWPYATQTGIGSLGAGLAERSAIRVCADPERDVILIANLNGDAIPPRLRSTILNAVRAGKGLMLTGAKALGGWPKELTAEPDHALAAPALDVIPWERIPGLRAGDRGRIGDGAPLEAYRYGDGRVLILKADIGRYSSLVPRTDASEGLDGATDRLLALNAMAVLAAAGREFPAQVYLSPSNTPIAPAAQAAIPLAFNGDFTDALVRVQDDRDTVISVETRTLAADDPTATIPPLPAGRSYFVDVMLRDANHDCVAYASTALQVEPARAIESVALSPSKLVDEAAVPMVDLADGGALTCEAKIAPPGGEDLSMRWEVRDCFDRLLATATSPVDEAGLARVELALSRPVAVCHQLDTTLLAGDRALAVRRDRFTIPIAYPYDEFTLLMWSSARGEPITRRVQRACYDLGADMMDLCHMGGYSAQGAAREYAVAARSGLRLVPYVTRIAMKSAEDNTLKPGLLNPGWLETQSANVRRSTLQATPYAPAAYTLGDENYLCRGSSEVDVSPESMAGFRQWLRERYADIDAQNETWQTDHASFDDIDKPMLLDEAADQESSFAPWFDFREYMDTAFTDTHERFADIIRENDPGAKVGWDGLLGYNWQAGYDFHKLTRNLQLNQIYTSHWLQAELVRSFKPSDALTGEWGNAIADNQDGFSAITWHNLFKGHNSCWWWTSWGVDYVPFNPDASLSKMGEWFFEGGEEVCSGPGRLLIHAERDNSGIAVLYNQADMFAAKLASKVAPGAAFSGERAWLDDHRGLLRAIEDLGYQYQHVAAADIEADPEALSGYRVLFLPLATCLSDRLVAAIADFAGDGGMVIADGRAGLLTANGAVRAERPLDLLFGVKSPAGRDALAQASKSVEVDLPRGGTLKLDILEPDLVAETAQPQLTADGAPLMMTNQFGAGKAALLNFPFKLYAALRSGGKEAPVAVAIGKLLYAYGLRPYSELMIDGSGARCIEQALFTEGDIRYLCLEQDILQRGLPGEQATCTIQESAFVYDVRAGEQIGAGRIDSWEVALARGNPRMFALLPYRVTALQARIPQSVRPGQTLAARVSLAVDPGEPQFHVVHLAVYAPGSATPHRQYSQNIECPEGRGEAAIPFALNDPAGAWRLEFTDAASGATAVGATRLTTPQ